jgi:Alternative complex III, ActD subunit
MTGMTAMTATAHAKDHPIYGLLAEFSSAGALIEAAEAVHAAGYRKVDAFTPYPIEEVAHALGHGRSRLPLIVLLGGLCGMVGGFLLQAWVAVIAYPINVAGRPLLSWPAFIVPTFELTILGAALSAVLGMFALNRLPQPYHPVFNVPRFALASRDRYFLVIESQDPLFDREASRNFLLELHASEVSDVEH